MTPRMNTSVNYGRWVIMIFQCSFVSCNKHPTLGADTDNRGRLVVGKTGGTWELCVLSSQFCREAEIPLKI